MADTTSLWTPPDTRVPLVGKGTPAAAALSAKLAEQDPKAFIVMAQGNHHPAYERMAPEMRKDFTHSSSPDPVYKGNPAGLEDSIKVAVEFETCFLGAPATEDNTLIIKQQGRYVHGMAALSLAEYLDENTDSAVMANMRWRVLDGHLKKARLKAFDYDVTAGDVVQSMKDAVKRAGGPEKVGMFYLCSPNNPTGRRFTAQEYTAIREFVGEVNAIRESKGLKKAIIFCDDPYFEAHFIQHRDFQMAAKGGADCYLETNYHALHGAPVVFMHSFSKFAEQAGTSGLSLAVSTEPEFTRTFRETLIQFGGLAYDNELMEMVNRAMGPHKHARLLDRCVQAGNVFEGNWRRFNDIFENNVLMGRSSPVKAQCNMVECQRVAKSDFMGCEVVYPDGEKLTINTVDQLVETLANFYGVGLVPEQDDRQVEAEGYDSENEVLIRYALNNPVQFGEGCRRSLAGQKQIAECVRLGRPLTRELVLQARQPAVPAEILAL